MSPERQRIAIAEACGWKRLEPFKVGKCVVDWAVWEKDGRRASLKTCTLPDYLNDLNACHDMEKLWFPHPHDPVKAEYWWRYCLFIKADMTRKQRTSVAEEEHWSCALHATAAQRAESFLRALGKWEEDES